jgi:hypothetical protein
VRENLGKLRFPLLSVATDELIQRLAHRFVPAVSYVCGAALKSRRGAGHDFFIEVVLPGNPFPEEMDTSTGFKVSVHDKTVVSRRETGGCFIE